jgi:GNAT superfamily N-acetyltransferase
MLTISQLTPEEFWTAPGIQTLIDAYAKECANAGLPHPYPDKTLYERLFASGMMYVFGAFDAGELIGFAVVLICPNPHYGVPLACVESIFVAKGKRKTGAGMRLIAAIEARAREKGAAGLLISAPVESGAAKVMAARYRETNREFFKKFRQSIPKEK